MPISVAASLVEAACSGGLAEAERLIEAAWPDAFRLALAVLGDRSAAEDAAQEACIALYRSISALRCPDAFRVWFYRIIVREAAAQKKRRARPEAAAHDRLEPRDHAAVVDLWRALDRLPQKLRDVVVLRYYEDLSSREIASVLGVPDGTVRFRLMTAKRHLRDVLREEHPDPPAVKTPEVRTHAI